MILNKALYQKHGYLKGLFVALKITMVSLIKNVFKIEKTLSINFPEEKYYYSDRFKGKHILTLKEDGSLRCTSCMLCATYCPADCIHIYAGEHHDPKVEKAPLTFEIELLRCVFCGFCEEACPVDAIRLGPDYTMAGMAEQEWLMDHNHLSKRRDLNGGKGVLTTVDDDNRMKLRL